MLIVSAIKEACLNRDLLGALMALAAGPISRAEKMNDEDHQVRLDCLSVPRDHGSLWFVRTTETCPPSTVDLSTLLHCPSYCQLHCWLYC
jgi:hypothetical protein